MPCCCSTAPGGTRPASSTCPPISPRSSCRREPRNSTQSKTSGSISARTGSQTPSSKTMTLSSTRLAAHGESSPPSPKRSRPSECEHGRMSVSPHDRWYQASAADLLAISLELIFRQPAFEKSARIDSWRRMRLEEDKVPVIRARVGVEEVIEANFKDLGG